VICAALLAAGVARPAFPAKPPGHSASNPKPAVRLDPEVANPGGAATANLVPEEDRLRPGEMAIMGMDGGLALQLRVPPEGLSDAWLARYLPGPRAVADFRRSLGTRTPPAGQSLLVPLARLDGELRVRVVRAIFPAGAPRDGDWVHRVGDRRQEAGRDGLDRIAIWYTGRSANARRLAEGNRLAGDGLRPGQEIVIPHSLLLPAFARRAAVLGPASVAMAPANEASPAAAAAPPSGATAPDTSRAPEDDFTEAPAGAEEEEGPVLGAPGPFAPPPMAEGANDLTYGSDSAGRYAIYRLRKGEALYSTVVVRFTGRIDVQEVNDLAAKIARRSRIADVTNIPIGFKVKIPLDDLLPEYLPRDDARRQAWERSHAQVARYTNLARSHDLEGVAVILDAGHGGRDIGASHNGVEEHDYVYDLMCRIKAVLERRTHARVLPTIRDRRDGYAVRDSELLARSQSEVLLTNPPFPLNRSVPSVNLRWYLSNAMYRSLVGEGFDPLKVVFTSLHADARHPSLGGAMVYVPGEEYRRGRYGSTGELYARYREAREEPFISFSREERERSEGLSRQLAGVLIDSFHAAGVAVHPYGPVRERIIRGGRAWVPAVLRCNAVPVENLIEVSNLSNPADARALKSPAYRQKVAEAYVDALMRYFAAPSAAPAEPAAATKRVSTSK
jgi:N-acetylmuramoyl-L-alanine amidase